MRETHGVTSPVDISSLFDLTGRTALVTGASSGLGNRFARVLHAAGATVVVTARRLERLEALAADLPGTVVIPADVGDPAARESLATATIEAVGAPDIVVNNAGIGDVNAIADETLESFQRVIEINLTSVWHLSKLLGPGMVERGSGSIVNIASMLGHVGSTPIKQANYCASKGGVVNLTRELALQWARKGVRVNALCPGWFESEMTEDMAEEGAQSFLQANSPIPRMGLPHELDGALLFLASDASTFMTGQSLVVDGGWTAR